MFMHINIQSETLEATSQIKVIFTKLAFFQNKFFSGVDKETFFSKCTQSFKRGSCLYHINPSKKIPNQTKIDKVFVKGKMASLIYKKISNNKKGKILNNKSEIDDLIRNDIKNNDYLMIKASLATGFNKIVNEIKGLN